MTFGVWSFAKSQAHQKIENQFYREAEQVVELISERMQKYEDALWAGVAAIHSQSHGIDYHEWKRFADTLKIEQKYPGISGIGVIYHILPEELSDYLAGERGSRPDFHIHPPHDEKEYWPITYIEPQEHNNKAVGLDMAHESNRYNAARKARDSGDSQITGPIILVQDAEQTPGFLFYAPFYERGAYQTEETRREKFIGLVYAPFIFKELMSGVLDMDRRSVGLSVIDITDSNDLLYDEHEETVLDYDPNPLFKDVFEIAMYGRTWQFDIWSTKSFRQQVHNAEPTMILIGGLVIDSLLLILFLALARANQNALSFASEMAGNYQREAERLEEANSELEEFSYRTSHDLRAPLVSSQGLVDRAIDYIKKKDDDKALLSLSHAKDSIAKLLTLIQDLLILTESKNVEEAEQPVNVSEALDDVLNSLQHSDDFKEIKIIKELDFEDMLPVQKMRFRLILENLISNAMKYKDLEKDEPFVKVVTEKSGHNFVLEISDNGLGIPVDMHDQMFSMFKRFHPNTAYGSGLGLYMVKKSAEILGGEIVYEDRDDGSLFRFTMPLEDGNTL